MFEAQSPFAPQASPGLQLGEQAGGEQLPFVQTPEAQSVLAPQTSPSAQPGLHDGAAQ
jgi:hypothetical protein